MLLTDTHTHIYYHAENDTLAAQMERCFDKDIHRLFLPNVNSASISAVMTTVDRYPNNCFPMLGLHPCDVKENYQVPFAEEIKTEAQILTGAVGLINNAKQAEVILQNQQADFILMARRFLQNPHIVKQFAQELDEDIDWLPQYQRAKETL